MTLEKNPLLSPDVLEGDEESISLRPQSLGDFVGQKNVCDHLLVGVEAAKRRSEALDHTLLYGPPGLGKTTLAQIVAKEMGTNIKITSGPIIAKSGDLAALLTNLQAGDVLFIDEIHRLHSNVEEVLYPAMEDFCLDLMIGEGVSARSVRIDLPKFTLVGATTRAGLMTTPLRDRFGLLLHMEFYTHEDLQKIVKRSSYLLGMMISDDGALEIAKRSRGTPRVAGRLVRRVRDFATIKQNLEGEVSKDTVMFALERLDIDSLGLDKMDRLYLEYMANHYGGGPVGVETLAAALANEKDVLEDVVEPFLMQQGLLQRSSRGRMLTKKGWEYLGVSAPQAEGAQAPLFKG